jgi:hypothetical protein
MDEVDDADLVVERVAALGYRNRTDFADSLQFTASTIGGSTTGSFGSQWITSMDLTQRAFSPAGTPKECQLTGRCELSPP